jgi:hypothetical protein
MKAKYWLIFANRTERKAKPFMTLQSVNKFIERNKDYITVVAKTRTVWTKQ